jgi:hypothetical protein
MKNIIIIILLCLLSFSIKAQTIPRPVQLLMNELNISQEDANNLLHTIDITIDNVKATIIAVAKYAPMPNNKDAIITNASRYFESNAYIAYSVSYNSNVVKSLHWYAYLLKLSKVSKNMGHLKKEVIIRFSERDTLERVTTISSYQDRNGKIHTENVADILFETFQLYIAYTTYNGNALSEKELKDIAQMTDKQAIKKKYTQITYIDITKKDIQCIVYKENGIWQCVVKFIKAEKAIKIEDFDKLSEIEIK